MDKIVIPTYTKNSITTGLHYIPKKSHKEIMFQKKWPFIKIITVIEEMELLDISIISDTPVDKMKWYERYGI